MVPNKVKYDINDITWTPYVYLHLSYHKGDNRILTPESPVPPHLSSLTHLNDCLGHLVLPSGLPRVVQDAILGRRGKRGSVLGYCSEGEAECLLQTLADLPRPAPPRPPTRGGAV